MPTKVIRDRLPQDAELLEGASPPPWPGRPRRSASPTDPRPLGRRLGLSHGDDHPGVAGLGLKPHRTETWFSTDPELEAKIEDVVGLYLNPPRGRRRAVRGREEPDVGPGAHPADPAPSSGARRRADSRLPPPRHRYAVRRLGGGHRSADRPDLRAAPSRGVPGVADARGQGLPEERAAHRARQLRDPRPPGGEGLARATLPGSTCTSRPREQSWLNLVDVFFSIIGRAIRRGSFTTIRELIRAIRQFIDAWIERCEPFVWTTDAAAILASANRQAGSLTGH